MLENQKKLSYYLWGAVPEDQYGNIMILPLSGVAIPRVGGRLFRLNRTVMIFDYTIYLTCANKDPRFLPTLPPPQIIQLFKTSRLFVLAFQKKSQINRLFLVPPAPPKSYNFSKRHLFLSYCLFAQLRYIVIAVRPKEYSDYRFYWMLVPSF